MRYVSYTRTTSCFEFEEIPATAIGMQNKNIAAYAKAHGFSIDEKYSDRKKDYSERSAFDKLLQDGVLRKFDCVVIDSKYRSGNSPWVAKEVLLQTFYYAGIHFIIVQDDFDSRNKTPEEVEQYFDEYYSYYKSRVVTERNILRFSQKKNQENISSEKKQSGGKHVESVISYQLYDDESKKHMNLRNINGDAAFTIVNAGLHYYSDPSDRISVIAAESLAIEALKKERLLATRVLTRIMQGEGIAIIKDKRAYFKETMSSVFNELCAGSKNIEEAEEYFLGCTRQVEVLEKALSVNNPWIVNMEKMQIPEVLTRRFINKTVKRLWLKDFTYMTVDTKWDEWKKLLPEDWLVI